MKAALALLALLAAGCGHHQRILRLQDELFREIGRGQLSRAADTERRLVHLTAKDYGPESAESFAVRARIAGSYGWWRETSTAVERVSAAISDSDAVHGASSASGLALRHALAWILVDARRYDEAEEVADSIENLCSARPPRDPACVGTDGLGLDALHFETGHPDEAAAELLRRTADGSLRNDRAAACSATVLIARWYAAYGRDAEARWYLRRCAEDPPPRNVGRSSERRAWSDASGQVTIDVLDSAHAFDSQAPRGLEDLVALAARTGDAEAAAALRERQARLWQEGPDLEEELRERAERTLASSGDDCLVAHDRNTLAWYDRGKGRRLDAIAAWQAAAGSMERCSAPYGRPRSAGAASRHLDILLGLAEALEEEQRHPEAREAFLRASALADTELHPRHAWRLEAMAGIARAHLHERRTRESEAAWRRYLDVTARERGVDHADYARGLEGLAATLSESGQRQASFDLHRRASRILAAYAKRMDSVRDLPLPPALLSPPTPAN